MRSPAAPFPWPDIMAFGLGRLGWAPAHFWAATPREIAAAMAAFGRATTTEAPDRSALNALMAAHPDSPERPRSR